MNIRIIVKHPKFSSVPYKVFYFDKYKDFEKYEEKLLKLGFNIKSRIKFKNFDLKEIKEVLKHNPDCSDLSSIVSKKEIIKKYGNIHGL